MSVVRRCPLTLKTTTFSIKDSAKTLSSVCNAGYPASTKIENISDKRTTLMEYWMSNFGFNFYLSNTLSLELAWEYQLCIRYGASNMCAGNPRSTLLAASCLRMSRHFPWHLRRQPSSYGVAFSLHTSPLLSWHLRGQTLIHTLDGILPAHI